MQYHGQLDNNFLVEVLELCDPTRMPKAVTATLSPKDKQILWFLAAGSWPWDMIHSQSKADVVPGQHFSVSFCGFHSQAYLIYFICEAKRVVGRWQSEGKEAWENAGGTIPKIVARWLLGAQCSIS